MFGGPQHMLKQETHKPKKVGSTLRRLGYYLKPYWWIGILIVLLLVVSTWIQVTTPKMMGQIVDCFLVPTISSVTGSSMLGGSLSASSTSSCWLVSDPEGVTQTIIKGLYSFGNFAAPSETAIQSNAERLLGLGRMIILLAVFFAVNAVSIGLANLGMQWSGQHMMRDLRVEVFRKLHQLHLGYYAEHEAGDLMSRVTNDAETIGHALNMAVLNVISGIMLLVWIIYVMLSENIPFALLSMAIMPFMVLATVWFSSQARKAFRKTRKELGNVNAELQEGISSVREAQAFSREDENIEEFRKVNAANRDANIRAVAFTSALSPVLEGLGYVALTIVASVGGLMLLGKLDLFGTVVSMGLVIAFIGYVQRFNQPIQQISILWTNIQNAIAAAERIFNLLDEKAEVQDAPDAKEMKVINGEVVFDDVCAEYIKGQPVLQHVSFTARPGQTIAIVGPTGAGKTTIANLIPRFYDICSGRITIDGMDVREVTAASLRSQIGVVLQDTFLFSSTVMENIRFGKPGATDEEVLAAAKLANADTFIERLPEKYQTVLGERGSGLSQGQRQLLSIARAALANPRILILDEATSSVDTRTERLIQKALELLLKGRTSFVIAHRLSTIRSADLLLVVDEGHIVESGKHEELLAKKGYYHRLYMSQFDANIDVNKDQKGKVIGSPSPAAA